MRIWLSVLLVFGCLCLQNIDLSHCKVSAELRDQSKITISCKILYLHWDDDPAVVRLGRISGGLPATVSSQIQ